MSIESEDDIRALLRAGRVVRLAIEAMRDALEPGITTAELDAVGERCLLSHGARSAPQLAYDFPGATCISVNDEVAHGIPGERVIQPGDVVNIDVSAELDGYYADSGVTVAVPPVSVETQRLLASGRRALDRAIDAAVAGNQLSAVGAAIENEAKRGGYNVIRDLAGHGVGRSIHEDPVVPNYYSRRMRGTLTAGMVITLEPFLTSGSGSIYTDVDGWTLKTADGAPFAQFEHTVIVTEGKPILVTAA